MKESNRQIGSVGKLLNQLDCRRAKVFSYLVCVFGFACPVAAVSEPDVLKCADEIKRNQVSFKKVEVERIVSSRTVDPCDLPQSGPDVFKLTQQIGRSDLRGGGEGNAQQKNEQKVAQGNAQKKCFHLLSLSAQNGIVIGRLDRLSSRQPPSLPDNHLQKRFYHLICR